MKADRKAVNSFLPYGRQAIEDDDIAAVVDVLRGDWLTTGPAVDAFEKAFAAKVAAPYAITCANGTAALHLTALALGLGPGDKVVVPTMTFLATANCAHYVGAEVVFADVDQDTGLLTPATLTDALARGGDAVKAVYPVHLTGQCVDLVAVGQIAVQRRIAVVEDACHALGGEQSTRSGMALTGSCRDSAMAIFSCHPVKAIATGEGGLVTTRDAALAEKLRRFRNHGMTRNPAQFTETPQAFAADGAPNPWYYEMPEPGFNYRLSDINCALGSSQLAKLDRFLARRRALADGYDRLLAPLAPLIRPIPRVRGSVSGWHLYSVLIDFAAAGIDRAHAMRLLAERGVGTQVHYIPVHRQPYYRRRYGDLSLPGADRYYERTLSLPLFSAMIDDDVKRVVDALGAVILKHQSLP